MRTTSLHLRGLLTTVSPVYTRSSRTSSGTTSPRTLLAVRRTFPFLSLPDPFAADIDIVQPESKAVIDCKTFDFDPAKTSQVPTLTAGLFFFFLTHSA